MMKWMPILHILPKIR